MPDEPLLLKVKAVAAKCDVSTDTVRRLVKSGCLPSVRVGRSLRIPSAAVDLLIAKAAITAPPVGPFDANSDDPAERERAWKAAHDAVLTKSTPSAPGPVINKSKGW